MERTGQLLKTGRESKQLSLAEVALATKISSHTLEAIENGDIKNLPPKSFLRGFVQTYATYLKLDTKEVLDSFREEMGSTLAEPTTQGPEEESPEPKAPRTPKAPKAPKAPKETAPKPKKEESPPKETKNPMPPWLRRRPTNQKLLAGAGIFALMLIVIGVNKLVEKYQSEHPEASDSEAIVVVPLENKKAKTQADSKVKDSNTEKSEESLAASPKKETRGSEGQEKAVQSNNAEPPQKLAAAEQKTAAPAPASGDEVRTQTSAEKAEQEETSPEPKEDKTEQQQAQKSNQQRQQVIVQALDKVTLSYQLDGQDEQTTSLEANQIHILKAKESLKIKLSDGGAVNVIHNGRDRGVPGTLGEEKSLRYP